MARLNQHFIKLVENLKPPDDRVQAAQDLPGQVRDYLRQCTDFATVDPHTRLAGSYRQHMSVSDVKDVDILVLVDADPETNTPQARQTIKDLKAALDALVDSDEQLGSRYVSSVEINEARRSVHVYFEDEDFHLDIVPLSAPDGLDEPGYVPDKGYNVWVQSHPLGVVKLISDLDEQYGGRVRRLGKILKHYRNCSMTYMKPKSYWLTALLLNAVQDGDLDMEQPLPELFRDLLGVIYDGFSYHLGQDGAPPILDPILGHNVAHSWEQHHFERFMDVVDEGRRKMDRALKAVADGKLDDAIAICQDEKMFGECFPTSVDDDMKRLAASLWPGTTVGLVGGTLSETKPPTGPYVQTQPTRFYGE